MEFKTQIKAEEGRQDLLITREFDLSLESLFRAYVDPEILEQWMGTKVMKLENRKHGSWHFITTDPKGHEHGFHGTIHEFIPNRVIVRTFEMENMGFGPQLEFLEFEELPNDRSKLRMQSIFRSNEQRDLQLKLPFKQGLNIAHNRLEEIVNSLNQ